MDTAASSFNTTIDAAEFFLTTLAFMAIIISIVSILEKKQTRNASSRGVIMAVLASVVIIYQWQFIIPFIGSPMSFSSVNVRRLDCLYSRKGGKRPMGDISDVYKNPCYKNAANSSHLNITATGEENNTVTNRLRLGDISTSICDPSNTNEPYIPADRDCQNSQRAQCSVFEPCTPCQISRFQEFHKSQHGWSRCQACSPINNYGACSFVDGVGPYCWKDAVSRDVVPCTACCTDGIAVYDDNGICH
eukprot:scaffold1327_cov65-Cyclotella_meneghiniana.AAC.5